MTAATIAIADAATYPRRGRLRMRPTMPSRGELPIAEALRRPAFLSHEWRLYLVARPVGLPIGILAGRAGWLNWRGRRLVYLKRGQSVTWYEWRRPPDPVLPFGENHAEDRM